MSGTRSERPTPRRLREARRRGEVAVSRELVAAAALGAGLAALIAAGPGIAAGLAAELRRGLLSAFDAEPSARRAVGAALLALARAAAAPLLAALAGGGAAGLLSARLFAPGLAAPRWRRLDPAGGLRRLASPAAATGLALGLAKAAAVLALAVALSRPAARALARLPGLAPESLPAALPGLLRPFAMGLAALLALLGLADLLLARRRLARSLRMTRDEVRREHRDEEGEPLLKAERRRVHRALASAGPVAGAAVLVVNPTRLAVALAHRRGSADAPVVLAKGTGQRAARLRAAARRAGVPVVRDVALARSLHRLAEVGDAIPEELYQAAAAVLVQVHGLGREVMP